MFKYILKRLGFMLVTFIIIVFLTFVLIKMLPVPEPLTGDLQAWRQYEKMGYGKPIMEQLGIWLKNIFTEFNFGYSTRVREYVPAWELLISRLPPSMAIGLGAILLGIPLGIALGYYAARKKNKWQDHVISTGVIVFVSLPSYIFGFLVLYFLCYKLDWWKMSVPTLTSLGITSWFHPKMMWRLMPAIITLSFGYIAGWTRVVRAELTEAMTSDYLLLARTKGLTKGQAVRRHALKNAMVPLFPGIIAAIIGILSGAMITEQLYGIPGVGDLFLSAMNLRDYDVIMIESMFFVFIGLLSGIVFDISRGFLDPRIRVGTKKGGNY